VAVDLVLELDLAGLFDQTVALDPELGMLQEVATLHTSGVENVRWSWECGGHPGLG